MVLTSCHCPEGKVEGETCKETNRSEENGKSRLQRTQEDVEEVKVIMLENLEKAEERKEKLSDLEDRADMLREQGKTFEKKTNQVKQQQKGDNKRMKLIFFGIGVAAAILIIGVIIFFCLQQ